jgi:hypothetical protein
MWTICNDETTPVAALSQGKTKTQTFTLKSTLLGGSVSLNPNHIFILDLFMDKFIGIVFAATIENAGASLGVPPF